MPVHQEAKTIEAFEKAVEAYVWRGAGHPEDIPRIERHYHAKKAALYALLGLNYRIPIEDEDDE